MQPFRSTRYRVGHELGHGGMGIVYRCHDGRLGRDVAVKVQSDAESDRVPFLREARLHSRLQHPSIVPVYDLDTAPDGRDFLVMREIEGRTLRTVLSGIRAGQDVGFGRHALLSAFARVCMAIDYCHRRGVLHRDLKPENIMLGEFGEVYVLDWGLAMERGEAHPRLGGTRGYAAPEQLEGENSELADVYALGVILLEILTCGEGEDDPPPELAALGRTATAPHRDSRPESARVLAAAIERFLEGERDLALRRKLADDAARDALAAAGGTDPADHRAALQQAGRALALDPDHPDARTVLRRLLTARTAELPAEVVASTRRERASAIRSACAVAAWGFVGLLAVIPLEIAMGVVDTGWFVARAVLAAVTIALCAGIARGWLRPSFAALTAGFSTAFAAIGASSLIVGPFIMIPSLASLAAVSLAMLLGRRWLAVTLLVALSLIAVPLGLELVGAVSPSLAFTSEGLLIRPRLIGFPPALTIVYLLVKELAILTVTGAMVGRFQDVLAGARQELAIHAWRLEQLVPER